MHPCMFLLPRRISRSNGPVRGKTGGKPCGTGALRMRSRYRAFTLNRFTRLVETVVLRSPTDAI